MVAILDFWSERILALFYLQVTLMLPTKFPDNWLFRSEEAKNRFSSWQPWRPPWIRTILATFDLLVTPILPTKFQDNWPFFQKKKWKTDFQDGGYLGFSIIKILAIFDQQVTAMLPTRFQVNWPLVSGEEAKNRFSRFRPWWPSWISNQNDFSYFFPDQILFFSWPKHWKFTDFSSTYLATDYR